MSTKIHIVEQRALEALSPGDYAACMRLGLAGGQLRDELRICRQDLVFATVLIVREDNQINGWALLSPGYNDRTNLMVYVRRSARRRGVGTALVQHALRLEPRPLVTTWDLASRCFYDKLGFQQVQTKIAFFQTSIDSHEYPALEPV